MRLVADTNVFVSASLKEESWPAETVRWIVRHGGLLTSAATELEVFRVLARPRSASKVPSVFIDRLHVIFAGAECVDILESVTGCRDPDDDKFLALAVNGHADVIVSGDADLLVLDSFRGIPIITPAGFIHATRSGVPDA